MKLIESSVEVIEEKDPFKKIEIVGRTCYKSSSEMTEETARKFYKSLARHRHTAMLEHATFCFEVSKKVYEKALLCKYLNCSIEKYYSFDGLEGNERKTYLVSGNLRAINESGIAELLSALYRQDPDLVYQMAEYDKDNEEADVIDLSSFAGLSLESYRKHKYITFKFICDRGVSHEIVRHRPASYAQESTRYCNYAQDKFGNEITCIEPANFKEWSPAKKFIFYTALEECEKAYLSLIGKGCTPQEARAVLPNSLKTEVIMTANCEEYEHFFNLRSLGTTGAPHPDMKNVADKAFAIYCVKYSRVI